MDGATAVYATVKLPRAYARRYRPRMADGTRWSKERTAKNRRPERNRAKAPEGRAMPVTVLSPMADYSDGHHGGRGVLAGGNPQS